MSKKSKSAFVTGVIANKERRTQRRELVTFVKKHEGNPKRHERRKRGANDADWHGSGERKLAQPNSQPATSSDVKLIDIGKIKVVDGRRKPNQKKVQDLVRSIRVIGLRTPVTVKYSPGGPELVTGLHRVEAAKILGWETIPSIEMVGDKVLARLWQIAENLHRAELTALEESEQIDEWVGLMETMEPNSEKKVFKKGRPESGNAKAARELPVPGKTEEAKRKNVERKRRIARIDPVAKSAAVEAGFDNSPTKLSKIAAEKSPEAQLDKVRRLKAAASEPDGAASTDGLTLFELMKSGWKKDRVVRPAWERAPRKDRSRFITEVLKYSMEQ
jgi:ParB-like chromosome segregation protein Spo0J